MKPELHALLSTANCPRALSEVIYQYCSPVEGIRKIDFLCGKRPAGWQMTCFIETRLHTDAQKLASRLDVRVFGDTCVFFEVPLASDFGCESSQGYANRKELPIPVSCKCSW